ncbi:ATP-binding protein [Desulfovibrio sp. JC010]|uniref:ATP-binding protein n=1 Tax=Desulfovibrio sp. JC010 TaxID=2593641 RepID=UPI0013CF4F68|nr:ATP-binding protein [Desulfovibrio sp. JC010]NDV26431.1 HAMP domain-containing protein [Desulfovibrio sp. JC010]
MSIKKYLIIAFGSILAVSIFMGGITIYTATSLQMENKRVIYAQQQLRLLKRVKATTNRMLKEVSDYILLQHISEFNEFHEARKSLEKSLHTLQKTINEEISYIERIGSDEYEEEAQENRVFNKIKNQLTELIQIAELALSHAHNGDVKESIRLIEEKVEPIYDDQLRESIDKQIDDEQEEIDDVYASLTETFTMFQIQGITTLGLLLANILFATGLAYRSIYRPITGLLNAMDNIGRGDYSVKFEEGDGEIGQLTRSLKRMTRDLTDTQSQLIQSSKLASIGQLSAGLAHEINRPLSEINTYVQTMRREISILDESYGLKESTEVIENKAQQITHVVNHLKQFSLQTDSAKRQLKVNQVVGSSFTLLKQQLDSHKIKLQTDYHEQLPAIKGNENELEQVFLNIISNARDAICARYDLSEGIIEVSTDFNHAANNIEICFRDNGSGISHEDLPFVFDPFFSTKSKETHSGLGLSVAYGIIQQHGGTIVVKESSRDGSVIEVRIPAAGQEGA